MTIELRLAVHSLSLYCSYCMSLQSLEWIEPISVAFENFIRINAKTGWQFRWTNRLWNSCEIQDASNSEFFQLHSFLSMATFVEFFNSRLKNLVFTACKKHFLKGEIFFQMWFRSITSGSFLELILIIFVKFCELKSQVLNQQW